MDPALPPDIEIGELWAVRYIGLTPEEDCIVIKRADPYVLIAEELLADLDPRDGHFSDGILTLHGRDGDVSYGLSHRDPYRLQWLGTRSEPMR